MASVKEIRTKDAMIGARQGVREGFWINDFLKAQSPNKQSNTGPFTHAVVMIENSSSIYDPSYGREYPSLVKWEDLTVKMLLYSDQETGNQITDGNTLGDEQTEIR